MQSLRTKVLPPVAGLATQLYLHDGLIRSAVVKQADSSLKHLGMWEESHAPPDGGSPKLEITFDPSYSQLIKGT